VLAITHLRARSQVRMEDFKPHYEKVSELIAKAPHLERLLMLGAEVAMKAGKVDSALAFLDRANSSLNDLRERLDRQRPDTTDDTDNDNTDDGDDDKESGFRELRKQFIRRFNAQLLQRQRALSSCALPFVERLYKGESPVAVYNDALMMHKQLLQIDDTSHSYRATIAIVGGIPQREFVHYPFESKGDWIVGKPAYDNYADTLGSMITALAPQAKLLFIPLGTASRTRGLGLSPNEA